MCVGREREKGSQKEEREREGGTQTVDPLQERGNRGNDVSKAK